MLEGSDTPLVHDGKGWLLGSIFQYYYNCDRPHTKEKNDFIEVYVRPTVEQYVKDMEASFSL